VLSRLFSASGLLSGGVAGAGVAGLVRFLHSRWERKKQLEDQDRREGTGKKLQDIGRAFDDTLYYLSELQHGELDRAEARRFPPRVDDLLGLCSAVGMPEEFTKCVASLRRATERLSKLSESTCAAAPERPGLEFARKQAVDSAWRRATAKEPYATFSKLALQLQEPMRTVYESEERGLRYQRKLSRQVRESRRLALERIASIREQLEAAMSDAVPGQPSGAEGESPRGR